MGTLRINEQRLWQSLMTMAKIGATKNGGCNRQALTELDRQGRDLFVSWCMDAGCTVEFDQMGNIFARRAGDDEDAPIVMAGSHLDTQPTGGKFDGVYGVLSGLEVIRTLNDHNISTTNPIAVISWTNEEGARFSPAMVGSGVWAGEFGIDYGHSRVDKAGITLKEALVDIGYLGELPAACNQPVKAAFELHIEQGPILENEDQQIGIVSGVQGMNWYDITIIGEACHAGPSPMEIRKDPFMALAPVIDRLYGLAKENAPWSRVTFGDISANPGSRNTVPESVTITMDLRHPDQSVLDDIDQQMRTIVAEECAKKGLEYVIHDEWKSPAVVFNEACVEAVTQATELLGYSAKNMVSGAGHDSVYVSRVAPTSMIFVPCDNGISHNEAENISSSQAVEGCNVLLHAMLQSAC